MGPVMYNTLNVMKDREERLKTLLYNAIDYMLIDMHENRNSDWTMEDICEEIADYLGSTIDELKELNVLDYDDLMAMKEKENQDV